MDPKGGQEYAAAAMSLVFHSAHPLIPTLRADVRLFQVRAGGRVGLGRGWGGGGCKKGRGRGGGEMGGGGRGGGEKKGGRWLAGVGTQSRWRRSKAPLSPPFCLLRARAPARPPARLPPDQVAGQSWFGGGCDLTPNYLDEQGGREFHAYWRDVCGKYSPALYPELKAWCDR